MLIFVCVAAFGLLAAGCSSTEQKASAAAAKPAKAVCAYRAGWQRLANRIDAPVYCPGWLPDPLVPQLNGRWNNIYAVDPDRSYLVSFVWQETGGGAAGGELHVNLRGYPGRTAIRGGPPGARTSSRSHASATRAGPCARTGLPPRCTRSARTPTSGTSCSRGGTAGRCTHCRSTSRRRSRIA